MQNIDSHRLTLLVSECLQGRLTDEQMAVRCNVTQQNCREARAVVLETKRLLGGIMFTIVPVGPPCVFDATHSKLHLTLTANVASSSMINASADQFLIIRIQQDVIGNRNFSWPSNVIGGMKFTGPIMRPNATLVQSFYFDGANAIAIAPGIVTP